MKKILPIALATLSFASLADTRADLVLKGVISPELSVSIEHETVASNLDLSKAANYVKVATLTEKSNYHTGYKMKARSVNGGKLVNINDDTSFVVYSLNYDGSDIPLNVADTQIYSTSTLRGSFDKDLSISYTIPDEVLAAGSHEDTIQFTIESN